MDFYEEIMNLDDEELEEKVEERISELEEKSDEENESIDTIGYHIGYNAENYKIDKIPSTPVDLVYIYSGYIPKGMRIVYGMYYNDSTLLACSTGKYYYVDDDSYILEFCKWIKDALVTDEIELFSYVLDFIDSYLGKIELSVSREKMHKMIYRNDGWFHGLTREHVFSDFKGKGMGACSEYSLMANNILNVLGYDVSYALGKLEVEGDKSGDHAFNIIEYTERNTGKKVNAIMDFCYPVSVYDHNMNIIDKTPFIGKLDVEDSKLNEYLTTEDRTMTFQDYGYLLCGNSVMIMGYERNRHYNISKDFTVGCTKCKRK